MMNVRTEKENEPLNKILYRWKKEWVRPYESIYSIFRNLCRLNVMQGSYVLNIFHITGFQTESVVPKLLMYGKTVKNSPAYETMYEKLFPDWYQEQTKLLSNLNKEALYQLIDWNLKYCPECMRENYHSFLFQFHNIEQCMFHRCNLIKTQYAYSAQGSINYGETEDIRNVMTMPLPYERTIKNEFYEQNSNTSLECYIPINSIMEDCTTKYVHAMEPFRKSPFLVQDNGFSFTVPETSYTENEISNRFALWFNHQKIPADLLNPKHKFLMKEKRNGYNDDSYVYTTHFLYYLAYEFLKPYNLQNQEKRKVILEISNKEKLLVHPSEEFELKLCFLWAVFSYDTLYYCFNNTAFVSPWTDEVQNKRHIYNGVHLLHLNDGYSVNHSVLPKADKIVILLYILKDLFFCTWNEFKEVAARDGEISVSTGWKLISVPEYYICKNKNDIFYTILRYNNGVHNGK